MHTPSSRNLSHDFPAYMGLSLRELLAIVLATTGGFLLASVVAGFFAGWLLAFGCVGLLLGFIVSLTLAPRPVARMKAGKPYGHVKKKTIIRLSRLGLLRSPYLQHQGVWRKSRKIGADNV